MLLFPSVLVVALPVACFITGIVLVSVEVVLKKEAPASSPPDSY